MEVDFATISLRESRSRVAHWSGNMQKVSTSACMKWRFTANSKAALIPRNPVEPIRFSYARTAVRVLPGHGIGTRCPNRSGFSRPNDQHRDFHQVADGVDGIA